VKNERPDDYLCLILGPDVIDSFEEWKDSELIEKEISVKHAMIDFYCADINIRSRMIRDLVKKKRSIKHLVPDSVNNYIKIRELYL